MAERREQTKANEMSHQKPIRLLGAFHKTGTALWQKILSDAESRGAVRRWHLSRSAEPENWNIATDFHSKGLLPMIAANPGNVLAVFCVRDPRDIVVSGAYHHMRAAEHWLHIPRKHFGGLTYQQKICSLADMQARFQFEMSFSAQRTIERIMNIPVLRGVVTLTKLETLVQDVELTEFARVFAFLGFDADAQKILLEVARDNSLFSSTLKPTNHIRSGRPAQYLSEFSDETLMMFNTLYPGVAGKLGYPP